MTDDRALTSDPDLTETVVEVFVEAAESPVAGGRWEIHDDTVRYIRVNGEVVIPAVVAADTLRTSPAWRRLT